MRYILKAESYDRRGARRKMYCIIAGSAVKPLNLIKALKFKLKTDVYVV
jgi:hypothetical protein